MYQRLADSDPDLVPPRPSNTSLRPLTLVLFVFLAVVFVFGIYMMVNNDSPVFHKMFNYEKNANVALSTISNTELNTESDEVVTRPAPKVLSYRNSTNLKMKYKIPDRVVLADKYMTITDCSETDDFFVEYFTMDPLPFNVHENSTVNFRMIMKEGFHWSTEVEIELEKWFFGLKMLALKLPCFSKYFGSCRFNFCDMLRLHWDEQFCTYIHNKYDMNCQCPDVLGPGVFIFDDWHYKPVMRKIMKYFSWFAKGWYNLRIKLYKKQSSTRPFLCYNTVVKVIAKHPRT